MSTVNPYQAPVVVGVTDPQQPSRGIAWTLFSFNGRLNRTRYWVATVGIWSAYFLFVVAMFVIAALIQGTDADGNLIPGVLSEDALIFGAYLPVLWSMLAVQVKRWHDRGKPGSWILIGMVPIVGPIWSLVETGFMPGTPGPNQFGDG